jgi:hypothetical protein
LIGGQVIVPKHLTGARYASTATLSAAIVLAIPVPAPAANDCPSALSGKGSFILERRASSKMEVFYDQSPIVRTTLQSGDRTLLETTQFQGLFELSRVDRGTKIEQKPKTDLAKFFPLKPKQVISADFEVSMNSGTRTKTPKLEHVGVQDYALGECTYSVIKFRRTETVPIVYNNVDYLRAGTPVRGRQGIPRRPRADTDHRLH